MDKSKFKTNSFITQFVSVNFLLSLNVWSEWKKKIYEVDNCLTLIGLPFLGCVAKTHKNLASVDAYPYAEKSSYYVFALWFAKESLFLNKALENMHLRNVKMWKRKNWNIIKTTRSPFWFFDTNSYLRERFKDMRQTTVAPSREKLLWITEGFPKTRYCFFFLFPGSSQEEILSRWICLPLKGICCQQIGVGQEGRKGKLLPS